MLDVEKYVEHWKKGSSDDWDVAQELIGKGRTRHKLFFAHLALEKAIKAHIFRHTHDFPPKIHNLMRLAELADFKLGEHQQQVLSEMNRFNIEGRYADMLGPDPTQQDALYYQQRAREVYEWLMKQL